MGADARRQASHFACAKVTDHAEPVVQVPCDGATPALAITSSGIQAEVLISAEYLGLGCVLGHGRSRDEQDNYSKYEQVAHISSCERIMLGMLTIIAWMATALQGCFDSSFLLANRSGRSAGDSSIADACLCPSMWAQIALSLYEFGLLSLRPGVIGQRELQAIRDGRMRIKHQHSPGIRLRPPHIHFPKHPKRVCRHLARIRRESVGDFH